MNQDVQIHSVAHVGPLIAFMLGILMTMLVIDILLSTFSTRAFLLQWYQTGCFYVDNSDERTEYIAVPYNRGCYVTPPPYLFAL